MTPEEENLTIAEKAARLSRGERPSQNLATLHDVDAISTEKAKAAVQPVKTGLRWNNILTGGGVAGIGVFLGWCLITMTSLQGAQAQTAAKQEADHTTIVSQGSQLSSIDSGVRVEVANLRKEMAEDRANTDRKLTDVQLTLQAVLREVKKR